MRHVLLFLCAAATLHSANAQNLLVNGGFENIDGGSLEGWGWECQLPWLLSNAAPDGGSWSVAIEVDPQAGCNVPRLYQLLPQVADGDQLLLSGWARKVQGPTICVAVMGFGTYSNGQFTSATVGADTDSYTWEPFSVTWTATLAEGDTAAVYLHAILVPGSQDFAILGFDGMSVSQGVGIEGHVLPGLAVHEEDGTLFVAAMDGTSLQSVALFDVRGRQVRAVAATHQPAQIPVGGMEEGVYVLRAISGTRTMSRALFLQ